MLVGILFLFVMNFRYKVYYSLLGSDIVYLYLGDTYEDVGVDVKYCSLNKCRDIESNINVVNNIDNNKIGTYSIKYYITVNKSEYFLERKVIVYEDEAPVITLKGEENGYLCPNKSYVEDGYSAIDNYDGDITSKVTINNLFDKIIYSVVDSSNNKDEKIRNIIYEDREYPVITLNGEKVEYINLNENYQEKGVNATDNCDGNISSKVIKTGNVDTSKIGNYTITYTVEDSKNNKTTKTRIVKVVDIKSIKEKENQITEYIKDNDYKVSVLYYNLESGYTYTYNPNKVYYGASLIKTLDALYVYENMEVTPKLRNFVKSAITVSNNAAHGNLLNIIGFNTLKAYGESLGAKNVLTFNDMCGNTTVYDQLVYYKKLWEVVHTNPLKEELKSYFINNYENSISINNLQAMHKYGYYGSAYHDAGIILDDSPYILIVLTNEANTNAKKKINAISQKVYELHEMIKK